MNIQYNLTYPASPKKKYFFILKSYFNYVPTHFQLLSISDR